MRKTTKPITEPSESAVAILEPPAALAGPLVNPVLDTLAEAATKTVTETPLAQTLPEAATPAPPLPPAVAAAAPVANPDLRYFRKVSVNMPMYVGGNRIAFEVLDQNMGVIKLNPVTDSEVIAFLDSMAKARKGGVVVIDLDSYTFSKKNRPLPTFAPRSQQQNLRVWDSKPRQAIPSLAANVAAVKSSAASSSRGSADAVVGDAAGAGKSPVAFTPNLQRAGSKSGVLKLPSTGKFRDDAGIPPQFPLPAKT